MCAVIISNLQITLRPGVKAAAIEAFKKRRVFEECAAAIPGFLSAKLLEVEGAPDAIAVIAEWTDATAFRAWVAHPVRAAQEADLADYLAAAPHTTLYAPSLDFRRST